MTTVGVSLRVTHSPPFGSMTMQEQAQHLIDDLRRIESWATIPTRVTLGKPEEASA